MTYLMLTNSFGGGGLPAELVGETSCFSSQNQAVC